MALRLEYGGAFPSSPAIGASYRVTAAGKFSDVPYQINDTITWTGSAWAKGVVWGAAFSKTYVMDLLHKLYNHTLCDINNGIAIVGKPRFVFGDPLAVQGNDLATWAIWTALNNSLSPPPSCPHSPSGTA